MKVLYSLVLWSGIVFSFNLYSQVVLSPDQEFIKLKIERLQRLQKSMYILEKGISETEKKRDKATDTLSAIQLENRLAKLNDELEIAKMKFVETATQVNLEDVRTNNDVGKKTLSEEIQEILAPAIDSIRQISEKPRQIENLNQKISFYENSLMLHQRALAQLESIKTLDEYKEVNWRIKRSINDTKKKIKQDQIKLDDLSFQKIKLTSGDETFLSVLTHIFGNFLQTKGKNLVLSFFTFILFFWPLLKWRNSFLNFFIQKGLRKTKGKDFQWAFRPLSAIYNVVAIGFSLFMSIVCLYLLNDLLLLTLVVLVLASLLWSLKQYLPTFFEQAKLILNLGTVREGERVIYNDLCWMVKSLGVYCQLYNPALSGGQLRVAARDLVNKQSRPIVENEAWFPTDKGDWVETKDGTFGKVIVQTPETVVIRQIGGMKKYLGVKEFLDSAPVNLSQGYSIIMKLGVDYTHQKMVLTEFIPKLRDHIRTLLAELDTNDDNYFHNLGVEFNNANTSSLDVRVYFECDPNLAARKKEFERKVWKIFVEVCNEHNYIIPFNQLTVHMQSDNKVVQ